MQASLKKFASDNNYTGTDKDTIHSYGPLYETIFAPMKDTCADILEIGVFSGGSLMALADYFESASIVGIDIHLERMIYGKEHPRIKAYQMDGTKTATAEHIGRKFDIIIDDGSHLPNHQVASLEVFGAYLKKGGVYIIEDINGAHIDTLRPSLEATGRRHGLKMEWHDLRSIKNRFDDIVAVFRHE